MNDDCGQDGPCATAPGCARHWAERNRELVAENERLKRLFDHVTQDNPGSSVVVMLLREIEKLRAQSAGEIARLRAALQQQSDAYEGGVQAVWMALGNTHEPPASEAAVLLEVFNTVATLEVVSRDLDGLRRSILDASVLRATCEKHAVGAEFRVHLRESEWDGIARKAGRK